MHAAWASSSTSTQEPQPPPARTWPGTTTRGTAAPPDSSLGGSSGPLVWTRPEQHTRLPVWHTRPWPRPLPPTPLAPLPLAVCAIEAAAGNATERALLARFAEYERVEADAHQEPLAGSLASLASVMPGGNWDGLQLYSDVLFPAGECTSDKVRDAALRDELRDHQGLSCAPSSIPKNYFAPDVLAASEFLGVVSSVQAAAGQASTPPGIQARGSGRAPADGRRLSKMKSS